MTQTPLNQDSFSENAALADEYVLGVLDQSERQAVQKRMNQDPELRKEIERAEVQFAAFVNEFDDVTPPKKLQKSIEQHLFGSAKKSSFWSSLTTWRTMTAAFALLAVASILVPEVYRSSMEPIDRQLIATLEGQDSNVKFLALYETAGGTLKIKALSGSTDQNQTFELWLIEGDQGPKSLGVLTDTVQKSISLGNIVSNGNSDLTFAISLEPSGGSPTGAPTGPVLAAGKAIEI